MTDIDPRADITLSYHDAKLHVSIPLADQVNEIWGKRYEALAQARDMQVVVRGKPDQPPRLHIAIPVRDSGSEVEAMLDTARMLIAEADAVELTPTASDSPEAVVRRWWARQRT